MTFKLDRVPHFVIRGQFMRCVTLKWRPEKDLV